MSYGGQPRRLARGPAAAGALPDIRASPDEVKHAFEQMATLSEVLENEVTAGEKMRAEMAASLEEMRAMSGRMVEMEACLTSEQDARLALGERSPSASANQLGSRLLLTSVCGVGVIVQSTSCSC